MIDLTPLLENARQSARRLVRLNADQRAGALDAMAEALERRCPVILDANERDLREADARGITGALRDRLRLDETRIRAMAGAIREIARQEDPVGAIVAEWTRPNGLRVSQVRIPLGVVALVYEARPNVTSDGAALCLKSGNAVVLRGGSEAFHSNSAIAEALREALAGTSVGPDAVTMLPGTDRALVPALLRAVGYVDLAVPRGGEALVRFVAEHARVPVLYHAAGVCHVYLDQDADFAKALGITVNAKTQRPGVCNAMETLIVHEAFAARHLKAITSALRERGVHLRGDGRACALDPGIVPATESDWSAEYLDLILAVRVVSDLDAALSHIARHGTHHTEAIVTENAAAAERFMREVDASCVLHNASTRFNDGGELGLGAELGISTTKMHAYGPMGVKDLTALKYVVRGDGQVRT